VMRTAMAVAGLSWLAIPVLAGCTSKTAAPTTQALAASAQTAQAAAVVAATAAATPMIPGISPTLVQNAACASATVTAMANSLAAAPSSSSVDEGAIAVLVPALAVYAGAHQVAGTCGT
jgi:hypothetical protein